MLIPSDSITKACALCLLALTACDAPSGAAISDFNGYSVKVVASAFSTRADEEALAQALETCKRAGKNHAENVSGRTLPDYMTEYLFICS
jgi:hypothetical protein